MINESEEVRFAVKALPASGARPNELTHTMAPHPLVYQELPYDPEYLLYNHRLTEAGEAGDRGARRARGRGPICRAAGRHGELGEV